MRSHRCGVQAEDVRPSAVATGGRKKWCLPPEEVAFEPEAVSFAQGLKKDG